MLRLTAKLLEVKNTLIHAGEKFFVGEDEGVTAVEYGLLVSLIAMVIITAVTAVGTKLSGLFNSVATNL